MPSVLKYENRGQSRFPWKKPPFGTPVNPQHRLATGLVLSLPLNEGAGTVAWNAVSNFNGSLPAANWSTKGRDAICYDSTGGGTPSIDIGLTSKPAALNLTGEMSVMAAVYLATLAGTTQVIFMDRNAAATLAQWGLYVSGASEKLSVLWANTNVIQNSGPGLVAGVWSIVGFVRSGSSGSWVATVYQDGKTTGNASTATNPSAQQGAAIGKDGNATSPNVFPFLGRIGVAHIWNRKLLPGDFEECWKNPFCMYESPFRVSRRPAVALPPPGTPTALVPTYASATSISLSWVQGSGTVTDNKVRYSTNNSTWTVIDIGSAATSYTVTGLTQNTLYFFQVSAGNNGGDSAYTASALWVCGCQVGTQIGTSNADAFENTLGTVTITDSTDTMLVNDYLGFYFTQGALNQFTDISAAFLVVNLTSVVGIAGSVSIDMQTSAASVFAATSNNISGRTVSGTPTTWAIGTLALGWNQSPNFASAVQAMVDAASWTLTSSAVAILKGLASAAGMTVQMWDGSAGNAAYLFVAYAAGTTDQEGAFGGQADLMASASAQVCNDSHDGAFIGY